MRPVPSSDSGRKPWASLTTLATLAMTSGTLLPVALGALGPFVVEDLAISRPALGVLVTVTFVGASLTSLVVGQIADRLDERQFLLAFFLYISAVLAATSLAPGYGWLMIPFFLAGIPLAAANPVTNKILAAHVDPSAQGMAMGIKQSGVPIGIFFAGIILPPMAAALGWQGSLLAAAAIPLIAAAFTLVVFPRPSAGQRTNTRLGLSVPRGIIAWLLLFAFFMGGGVAATHTFLPLYAHEVLGFEEGLAGITLSVIGVTGIIARILWTHLSSRAESVRAALLAVASAAVLSSVAFLAAPAAGTALVWIGAAIQGGSAVAWAPIAMLAVLRNVSYQEMGHASAMVNLGFFAGFILSPPAFGSLVESLDSYVAGWMMVGAQFVVAVLVLLLWRSRTRTPHRVG